MILALTQMLGAGTVALVAQAAGRKDQPGANLIFNQSVLLSALCGVATLAAGFILGALYLRGLAADTASAAAGLAYLYAYTPGLALQFALVALGSALRGTGIVKPTMLVQMLTVLVNLVLAPVLIAGWGTHHPLGTAGAGLASSIAVAVGVVLLWLYFARLEHYVQLNPRLWRPHGPSIRAILNIGLPAGGEFLMMFVILAVIYWVIRSFGPAAQAGFGIGGRVMQALFLPVMALAFGTTPLAGQNYGGGHYARVRATFRQAALLSWRADAALDPGQSVARGPLHPAILGGTAGADGGGGVPAHHFLEFRRHRADFRLLGHVPGARQRLAVAAEFGVPGLHLRTAGRVAVDAPGLHAHPGLAPVGGERDPADADESVAAADASSGANSGQRRSRAFWAPRKVHRGPASAGPRAH